MKKMILSALAFVVYMTFTACSDHSIEGETSFMVFGQIYDKQTFQPVPEARLYYGTGQVDTTSQHVLTAHDGWYHFELFWTPHCYMRVTKPGYITADTNFALRPGFNFLNFGIERERKVK
ncbi:MAG: hypothetical protein GWO41_00130 [candidate division Zixibacteria bacterium]|nr:hypothetical protein [candidate division Zixibacteria bacterium]NIR63710.1 hypothetical protein [candidate division Zixibacteria bacterium]NIS14667.1 hypothetical protein [candidate division Zixibacteria bacterium]NIS45666.1 hypothetical protein [candidate division Zixibacteria bacterium]NIT51195.1 hypothetical protein [candidate division Zixibacteria bacterium]